jgi:hypothetical protein
MLEVEGLVGGLVEARGHIEEHIEAVIALF